MGWAKSAPPDWDKVKWSAESTPGSDRPAYKVVSSLSILNDQIEEGMLCTFKFIVQRFKVFTYLKVSKYFESK